MKIKQKKRVKKTSMRRRKLVPASLLQCTVIQSRKRRRKKSEFYCMDVGDINLVFNETPTVHFIIIM